MARAALETTVTRLTAGIALVVEVVDFAGKALHLVSDHTHELLEGFSILLFLISLVSWLEASNKSMARLDILSGSSSARLDALSSKFEEMDIAAKYGAGSATLIRLLHPLDERFPHCRAAGEVLTDLMLSTYGHAADQFHQLRIGNLSSITLPEKSIINMYLEALVRGLPPGSFWFGVSRLQDIGAWEGPSAEPSYCEFEREMEDRIGKRTITCMRVLCFQDQHRFERMLGVAQTQRKMGLHLRSITQQDMPDDLSLVWVPKTPESKDIDLNDPIGFLDRHAKEYEPLCGLHFQIRGDREVYGMTLVGAKTDEFLRLKLSFRKNWSAARRYPDDKPPAAAGDFVGVAV